MPCAIHHTLLVLTTIQSDHSHPSSFTFFAIRSSKVCYVFSQGVSSQKNFIHGILCDRHLLKMCDETDLDILDGSAETTIVQQFHAELLPIDIQLAAQ